MAVIREGLRRLTARRCIGIDLAREPDGAFVVRAVGVTGERIRWRRSTTLDTDADLAAGLGHFLRSLPHPRFMRPAVVVALGPASIQLKRLPRLPPLTDPRALTSLVREGASRFFVRNGIPLVTSALRVDGPGDAWGAAVERPLLDAIARGCDTARLRLKRVVPAASVLGHAVASAPAGEDVPAAGEHTSDARMPADTAARLPGRGDPAPDRPSTAGGVPHAAAHTIVVVRWADGVATHLLTYEGARLVKSRRLDQPRGGVVGDSCTRRWVAALGPDGGPFAVAYAAAVAGRRQPIAWRVSSPHLAAVSRRRLRALFAACSAAVIAACAAAPLGAAFAAARSNRHLRTIAPVRERVLRTVDSLRQLNGLLQDAATFAQTRHAVTPLLAALTVALPAHTALTSIRIDTASGTLVALTPNASDLVSRLEQVPGLAAPELTGPVTSQPVAMPRAANTATATPPPSILNQVTVRFRLVPVESPRTRQTARHGRPTA